MFNPPAFMLKPTTTSTKSNSSLSDSYVLKAGSTFLVGTGLGSFGWLPKIVLKREAGRTRLPLPISELVKGGLIQFELEAHFIQWVVHSERERSFAF